MKIDRRRMLAMLPAAGLTLGSAEAKRERSAGGGGVPGDWNREIVPLTDGWEFRFGDAGMWMPVTVPHTWQSLGGDPSYVGTGTYRISLQPYAMRQLRWLRLECEAAFHTAHIALDGKTAGEHIGKGYTAFTCDLSPLLEDRKQELVITVNNSPGDTMLPRNDSYDWANDGGLIRPVNILATPRTFIERVEVQASPNDSFKSAKVSARVVVRNAGSRASTVELRGCFAPERDVQQRSEFAPVRRPVAANSTMTIELAEVQVTSPLLWHFDRPDLYAAEFLLTSGDGVHCCRETFGIRTFEVRGQGFFLNGEPVSLMGVERMAGSNPNFGMAETGEWIRNNHDDMKALNCVYTRVHWPQDKRVLDYCDHHGILMQEEIPAWGAATFHETTDVVQHALEQNGLEQLREMVARDRNHPCIVTWGLCNEVNGKNPRTRQFAHTMSKEATRLDPRRLQTYASNTLFHDPGEDMAGDFSFISTNEYFGTWESGGIPELEKHIAGIRAAFPEKPIVVSEYGWCECQPKVLPGDDNRADIVNGHTDIFRNSGTIAGAIYFDYNDYRTLMGDKGSGAFRQRVHGVVDLYADRKTSFEQLRLQSSPFAGLSLRLAGKDNVVMEMTIRQRLPGYILRGYQARWIVYGYDDLPMAGSVETLPDLEPGAEYAATARLPLKNDSLRIRVEILRPTGFSVASVEMLLADGTR